jgi:hypothetical protein
VAVFLKSNLHFRLLSRGEGRCITQTSQGDSVMTKLTSSNNGTVPASVVDSGKIRTGAGWGLLPSKK